MPEPLTAEHLHVHGLPCHRLSLPNGDTVTVACHGAQVLSWVCAGSERLYLSPRSIFDGQAAIRGGVPICFPQFNLRGALPKHGFVRNLPWQALAAPGQDGLQARLSLRLSSSAATRAYWANEFELTLTLELLPQALLLQLDVHNIGQTEFAFTGALHTYLRVNDLAGLRLQGLGGQPAWDAVTDQHGLGDSSISFGAEFDRVYDAPARPLCAQEGAQRLQIEQSASFEHTVVWNPGAEKCASLADMPADGWRHMLCIEAAQVLSAQTLGPGQSWSGWQRLSVL